jgi:hypothetical protein
MCFRRLEIPRDGHLRHPQHPRDLALAGLGLQAFNLVGDCRAVGGGGWPIWAIEGRLGRAIARLECGGWPIWAMQVALDRGPPHPQYPSDLALAGRGLQRLDAPRCPDVQDFRP